ncbi:hypothetical protein JS533_010185 [Bifidobacterium amazonense]|uniref:LigA n=1 Tax=Bifidobacterium amazonense TaxID=2809027 RepID=A0ABS9VX21_9BIFI|nr:hypothetical protein [Bifidobacterium amazonense]MCH9276632.1 hypothetical protein [Bifidobacterium amazonense]
MSKSIRHASHRAEGIPRASAWLSSRYGALLLFAALLIYSGSDVWQNISWPPFYSFDETLEVDYVYQLTQGHLPTFFGGAEFNPLNLQYPYDVQWRYQHPPLFYLLEMPVFLAFDTVHHPIRGIWAMRGLVWVLGVVLIVASRWAAKQVLGREGLAVALVPVVVAANRCLPSVVFNYTLASLWVTLLIGMTAFLVRRVFSGDAITPGSMLWWLGIVALAPLTRLSTVPIMALCILVVLLAVCIQKRNRVRNALALCVIPSVLAVASSAWFYIRLYRLSGNFTGSQPQWSEAHLHRDIHKSLWDALLDLGFYKSALSQYQNSVVTYTNVGWACVVLLTIAPLIVGLLVLFGHATSSLLRAKRNGFTDLLIAAMLLCALCGTVLQQLMYYAQGGSGNAVYFSLISIVFAISICSGLAGFRNRLLTSVLASLWMMVKIAAFLYEVHLKWPFAENGTMVDSGMLAQAVTYGAVAVVIVGVMMVIALICLYGRSMPFSDRG